MTASASLQHGARVADVDWAALRAHSLLPRGFGAERACIWTSVLRAQHNAGRPEQRVSSTSEQVQQHKDERQIKLDTDRSFVLYPVADERKEQLKHELNSIIVEFFRKRPDLHYFQGFHDIVSVLFLTLPHESLLPAIEKLSLHRLRDSMGTGLEPMIGQLRILKRLLRLANPDFASVVESTIPLPYYALSNLLTLFSHDVPTLPLIQHVFDYLLCRPPIASIYLAVAVILSHSSSIYKLVQEDEDGMLHAVLTTFPSVTDGSELYSLSQTTELPEAYSPTPREKCESSGSTLPQTSSHRDPSSGTSAHSEDISQSPSVDPPDSGSEPTSSDSQTTPSSSHESSEIHSSLGESSALLASTETEPPADDAENNLIDDQSTLADDPLSNAPSQSLVDLLHSADDLWSRYPPSDSRLAIERILGPQSVMFTWSEHYEDMPSDDDAEKMVNAPELVVRADFVDEDDLPQPPLKERQAKDQNIQSWWFTGIGNKTNAPSPATIIAGVVLVVSVGVAMYDISRRTQGKDA